MVFLSATPISFATICRRKKKKRRKKKRRRDNKRKNQELWNAAAVVDKRTPPKVCVCKKSEEHTGDNTQPMKTATLHVVGAFAQAHTCVCHDEKKKKTCCQRRQAARVCAKTPCTHHRHDSTATAPRHHPYHNGSQQCSIVSTQHIVLATIRTSTKLCQKVSWTSLQAPGKRHPGHTIEPFAV